MKVKSEIFLKYLKENGINFFCGVPDSLLKDFCGYLSEHVKSTSHIITSNEGNAVALATGHYLATNNPGLVYLQNSGLGNAVNPLISLADDEVYGIPMLLLIGWRGEPGSKDEPQHMKQGKVLTQLLDSIDIPWLHLNASDNGKEAITKCLNIMQLKGKPVALLISKDTFESYSVLKKPQKILLTREQAIKIISDYFSDSAFLVCTTGMASRELYEQRNKIESLKSRQFLTVGSMGHASSIALGIAQQRPEIKVICIDGDGACLMHMGALATIGQSGAKNFIHILINNGSHESVGGQPTVGFEINFTKISKACGYKIVKKVKTSSQLFKVLLSLQKKQGPVFIEVQVQSGHRQNLGRPEETPSQQKKLFMETLNA